VLAHGDEMAERFGAAGFASVVAPFDPDAAAAAILRLIEQPDEREAARAAGRKLADAHRWSALVAPLAEQIEAAAASRRRPSGDRLVRTVSKYYVQRTFDHASGLARLGGRG